MLPLPRYLCTDCRFLLRAIPQTYQALVDSGNGIDKVVTRRKVSNTSRGASKNRGSVNDSTAHYHLVL